MGRVRFISLGAVLGLAWAASLRGFMQLAAGDQVWTRSVWQGTHQRPFLGVPPTGKNVTVAAWTIDRFTDGKIAESRIIMDTLGLMQQLGVIPTPGPPPA